MTAPVADPRRVLVEMDFGACWQALNAVVAYRYSLPEYRRGPNDEMIDLALKKLAEAESALRHSLQIPFPHEDHFPEGDPDCPDCQRSYEHATDGRP